MSPPVRDTERIRRMVLEIAHALPLWVLHDLRRSMATHMERIGVAPHVIEVCLGHVLKGVAGTYRQYAYLPEKAAALQRWADELMAASRDARAGAAEPGMAVPAGAAAAEARERAAQIVARCDGGAGFGDAGDITRQA
jgi:hypothetical protein